MRYLPALLILGLIIFASACADEDASLLGAVEDAAPSTSAPTTTSSTTQPSTTTTPPTTTTTTTLPQLVMGFAGDTAFTHGLASYGPLDEVAELLSAPDLTLVNLETTIAETGVGGAYAKKYTFKSPPESTELLTEAGIDGVALGNNHMLDFGQSGLFRTIELLDGAGIARAGAGADKDEAYAPMVFEAAGRKVAVLSFSRILSQPSWAADTDRPGIASAYPDWLPETVAAVETAGHDADLVVVMAHWGIELNYCPEPYQREFATAWVAAGADLVVGSHPHVLQGVEQMGDAWVVYSTGNFAFPSARGLSDDSAVFEVTFDETGTRLVAQPVHIVNGRPHPASETQAPDILELLSDHSFGFVFDEKGMAIPSSNPGLCG
jgi:poly-gamma-glutamate synthesis protein (capsule biosynthesis protein)